ncbi:MAG TPA: hypothetical protein VFW03_26565 [Gemmatimonadaceae bacterium]|nr:hypothetical protein [Gemmatimonadaceae bacterium]
MSGPSLNERIGDLVLPPDVATVTAAGNLTSLDPARRILADLFKAAIQAELTDAWIAAVGNRLAPEQRISATTPVADVLELEPTPQVMTTRQAGFPLLAVYRSGQGEYSTHTIYSDKLTQPWTVDWILGPADVALAWQLCDTAVAVSKIISRCIARQGHPAYQSGAVQFGAGRGDLGAIRMVRHEGPGQAKFVGDDKGTTYWAITMQLETIEYVDAGSSLPDYGVLEGADYDMGIGGTPEGVIHGLLYASTDPPVQRG